jgi:hypothetical protein
MTQEMNGTNGNVANEAPAQDDKKLMVLRFGYDEAAMIEDDWVLAPGATMRFCGRPEIALRLMSVRAVGLTEVGEIVDLPITEAHIGNTADVGSAFYRVVQVTDNKLDGLGIRSWENVALMVHNNTTSSLKPKVVACGGRVQGHFSDQPVLGRPSVYRGLDYSFSLSVAATPHMTYRLPVTGNFCGFSREFPRSCIIRTLTIRSNSKLDVNVSNIRVGNESITVGGGHPIEFYKEGWVVRSFAAAAGNSLQISLDKTTEEDRWVEIDIGVMPIKKLPLGARLSVADEIIAGRVVGAAVTAVRAVRAVRTLATHGLSAIGDLLDLDR